MKQLLTGLATHRKPTCTISAGLKAALHRFANPQVFVLHLISNGDALLVISTPSLAHVAKIKIKYYLATVNVNRSYEVRIQISLIAIKHKVGMQPEVPRPIALSRRTHGYVFIGTHHRT